MGNSVLSVAFATLILAVTAGERAPASATLSQNGPELSGRWTRDTGGADGFGWGPRVDIAQTGGVVTVRPGTGTPSRFRLDGKETAEVLSVDGCRLTARITKAVTAPDHVTVTTWIATKHACIHGEDEDDPLIAALGVVDAEKVFGQRKLESITAIYRENDTLTVETTRSRSGATTTTSATFRK